MAALGEVDNISSLKIVYYLFSLLLLLFKYYTTTKGLKLMKCMKNEVLNTF